MKKVIVKYQIPDFSTFSNDEIDDYFNKIEKKLENRKSSPKTFNVIHNVTGGFVIILNLLHELKDRGCIDIAKWDSDAQVDTLLQKLNINTDKDET